MTVFKGSGVAIVTPFNVDGSVNFECYEKLIEYQINNGTDAIISCGTTGEASTLSDEEQIAVVECAVKAAKKRVPVIAGAGSNDTEHGIKLSKAVQKVGADALLSVTPYYNKCTQKGLVKHYQMIANSVDLPIILYSVPSRTGVNITPATAYELSKTENIVAIKEATGNIVQIAEIAELCGDKLDLYSGNDDQIVPILSLGGIGVISVIANVTPKDTHDLVMHYLNGNCAEALKIQLKSMGLVRALFCEVNPIPVKAALNLMNMNVGGMRMPLTEIEPVYLELLKKEMTAYGIL